MNTTNPFSSIKTNRISQKDLDKQKDWAEYTADQILARFPDMELYTCGAGISPSGVVHFGNFRDIMTALSVKNALIAKGKKARLLFSWDDYDRFRKVPKGVDLKYIEYLGLPLTQVPDPTGEYASYAEKFEKEFEASMVELGVELDYRRQSQLYPSGIYRDAVVNAMQKREKVAEILYSFMSEKSRNEKYPDYQKYLAEYYPINIYSKFTGKDNTQILSYDGQYIIKYLCLDTNQEAEVNMEEEFNLKLSWKIDWPMRWRHEGVVFEPAGKDHATPGGSYDVSAVVAKEIYGSEPPFFVGYDFVGISGIEGKMSSSAGNALSPGELLQIYTPELLKWTYNKVAPQRTFNLSFGTEIYRQYDDLDRNNPAQNAIPFKHAVAYGQIVNWNIEKLVELLKGIDLEYSLESILERLPKAKTWLEKYNRNEMIILLTDQNTEYFKSLTEVEQTHIKELLEFINSNPCDNIESINLKVYAIPKDPTQDEQANKKLQRRFFENVYQLLIGKDTGPRLETYIWAVDKAEITKLLSF